ncbi:hypothetical protein AGDE_02163 [Angomonas deanei]|nr:hypothetical protein AGDE_02163 [Angomonas deanei]|eukprot:EPY41761.1 hypothetical protein AGDE_02163 [Angomonas deanei]
MLHYFAECSRNEETLNYISLSLFFFLPVEKMYSDGERKTVSELHREAEAIRNQIVEEALQLERIKKATAKTQFSIDQLFRFFASEAETEEEKRMLVDILTSDTPDLHVECVPLLPIIIALTNARLSNTQRIFAEGNAKVDDSVLIFLVHVLRFSPQATQIEYLDISNTRVSAKGMCFLYEMLQERTHNFTLVAKNIFIDKSDPYYARHDTLLAFARAKQNIRIIME